MDRDPERIRRMISELEEPDIERLREILADAGQYDEQLRNLKRTHGHPEETVKKPLQNRNVVQLEEPLRHWEDLSGLENSG